MQFAWKMVKDGDSNEKTIATGLLETLTRVDSGREALAALRPWSLLWTGVSQGSAAYSAECMAVLCNLIQGWQTGLELALENKRLVSQAALGRRLLRRGCLPSFTAIPVPARS